MQAGHEHTADSWLAHRHIPMPMHGAGRARFDTLVGLDMTTRSALAAAILLAGTLGVSAA